MVFFDDIQDVASTSMMQWYRSFQSSTNADNDVTLYSRRDMDSIENSLFSSLWDSDDTEQGPYLYHASQAVSLVQSYQRSTQDLIDILDMMKYLVDQAETGVLTSGQAQSSQAMWTSLVREYENVIEETSSQISLRLNNEQHALGLYIDSDHMVEVRTVDLNFDVSSWELTVDSQALQDAIESQQTKIKDYRLYLNDRLAQLEEQGGISRIDYAQAVRDGVNMTDAEVAKELATQVTNDTMQLGLSTREAFKVPSSMHVEFATNADYPPLFWMLN